MLPGDSHRQFYDSSDRHGESSSRVIGTYVDKRNIKPLGPTTKPLAPPLDTQAMTPTPKITLVQSRLSISC
jgi:hypothetical protein